jgi:uncharacterized peroxidase-related enzyme
MSRVPNDVGPRASGRTARTRANDGARWTVLALMERAGMFVDPVSPDGADGAARRIYEDDLEHDGYISNTTLLYSLNPAAYDACDVLRTAILESIDDRTYELATFAAARALRCRYCVSAHGAILRSSYFDRTRLEQLTRDFRSAGLEPRDLAVMELAEQVAVDATRVTAQHVAAVRTHGLSDREIFGVVLAAAYRAFYSKTLDAMGCQPDEQLVATNDLIELVDQSTLAR